LKREAVIDLDEAPVVIAGRRWGFLLDILAGTVWLHWGATHFPRGGSELRYLLLIPMVGWAVILLRGLWGALRRYRLTLEPEGLRSDRWFSRTWRWNEISNIRWRTDDSVEFISGGRRVRLPTGAVNPAGWRDKPVSEYRLAQAMKNAQARWG